MQVIERIPQVEGRKALPWQRYLIDTLLALAGASIITAIIYTFHLYPAIPNISIAYLLIILPLAILRGRYAAVLTAVLATLSFDFFLVPPLYTFVIDRREEWLALIIFLITALLTGQMAAITQQGGEEARLRERETRILYELIRLTNTQERLGDLLQVVALSIVRVFSPWGVRESALLLPDAEGRLTLQADAPIRIEPFVLSPDEMERAEWVMSHGKMMESRNTSPDGPVSSEASVLSLLPLKTGDQVLGVLALRLQQVVPWFTDEELTRVAGERLDSRTAFFWAFLEQAASVIERARLRATVNAGRS